MPIKATITHAVVGRCADVASSRASLGVALSRVSGWGGIAGSWGGPSSTTYNALLTSKGAAPMIGVAGLLKLLEVVSRLQPAQQACACAPQEAGVPCLSSPPHPSSCPALPPAHEGATSQSVGPVTCGQPATTSAAAESPRRAAVRSAGSAAGHRQRGGQP